MLECEALDSSVRTVRCKNSRFFGDLLEWCADQARRRFISLATPHCYLSLTNMSDMFACAKAVCVCHYSAPCVWSIPDACWDWQSAGPFGNLGGRVSG